MISFIARIFVVIGALNWGAVGLGIILGGKQWNLVHIVLGGLPILEALVYVLIGLSAVRILLPR